MFSDAGKALQSRKIILKICDVCVNGTDESPTYPATRIKFCVAGYLKYVIYSKQYFSFLKRDSRIK